MRVFMASRPSDVQLIMTHTTGVCMEKREPAYCLYAVHTKLVATRNVWTWSICSCTAGLGMRAQYLVCISIIVCMCLGLLACRLKYAGRNTSASTATGFGDVHAREQAALVAAALDVSAL